MFSLATLNTNRPVARTGGALAIGYAESRTYTEPLFMFVIMVVAASKPGRETLRALISPLARLTPRRKAPGACLPLSRARHDDRSFMEPAAMTLAGGGLTVVANAPNPAGVSLLRGGFNGRRRSLPCSHYSYCRADLQLMQ